MKKSPSALNCYIAAYRIPSLDPHLEKLGFCNGMVLFAIPEFGILFRCRAGGQLIDLEFAAFWGLLKFIRTRLDNQKIKSVRVHSSNPEFIFAFTQNGNPTTMTSARKAMLSEFQQVFKIEVAYVTARSNEALVPAANCPPLPPSRQIKLIGDPAWSGAQFKPFQTGPEL